MREGGPGTKSSRTVGAIGPVTSPARGSSPKRGKPRDRRDPAAVDRSGERLSHGRPRPAARRRLHRRPVQKGGEARFAAFADDDARAAIRPTSLVEVMAVPADPVFGVAAARAITGVSFPGRSVLIPLIDPPFAVSPVASGRVFGRNRVFGARRPRRIRRSAPRPRRATASVDIPRRLDAFRRPVDEAVEGRGLPFATGSGKARSNHGRSRRGGWSSRLRPRSPAMRGAITRPESRRSCSRRSGA